MKIITVEEHYADRHIGAANKAYRKNVSKPTGEMAELMKFYQSRTQLNDELTDIEEKRLSFMDENKITMQVLSIATRISDDVPAEEAVKACKQANDDLAELIKKYPGRFAAFAKLPMADPCAAAEELERCVKEHGFCGTLLAGKTDGKFYDDSSFFPVFEKAAELDVPVYFHPSPIDGKIQDYYYKSDSWSIVTTGEFASAGFGWHIDVGIQVVRMILSGIFDKLPNLKLICGHWGEMIPSFLERMDDIMTKEITGLRKTISEYFKEHIYLSSSGIMSDMQLEYLVKLMGADHILYSVDYPYIKPENIYGFLADANITDEEKELIAHGNAERLLHIDTL